MIFRLLCYCALYPNSNKSSAPTSSSSLVLYSLLSLSSLSLSSVEKNRLAMATPGSNFKTTDKMKLANPAIAKPSSKISSTMMSNSKVRVIVRVRPFLPQEIASKNGDLLPCVSLDFDSSYEVSLHLQDQETSRHACYKLDGFFGENDNNVGKIFDKEVKPFIPGIFNGGNATVFAYGATGSGKTYTMQGTDEQPGLMPLAMSTVLSMCQITGSIAEISYYEVYLDRCYDLLEVKEKEISVLDDKEGLIHLRGLSRVSVNSMSEFHEVFGRGIQRRKVAHTGLNDVSSRSHAVLVINVSTPSDDGTKANVLGKLTLIDLAGNEDNRRSGNEGIRMQESAKINQSLFALSNVIYALNNNKSWVPYRASKLTRILQDSLGGTCRALMVACLNPGDYQESVHTVSLAARTRQISAIVSSARKQETPNVKIDMEAKLQAWLESKGRKRSAQRTAAFGSPFFPRTPASVSSLKKHAVHHGSLKAKADNKGSYTAKDRFMSVPQRKMFDNDATSGFGKEVQDNVKECTVDTSGTKSTVCLPDELLEEKKMNHTDGKFIQSPPNRPECETCLSPLRKALSPINSNITRMQTKEISSTHNVLSVLLESTTPATPFVVTREKFVDFGTPLNKFHARSCNLKSCLVEEYIDFLNTATREELMELKGIGVKRAEYIINLRENSPLKSLNDLEKIGLSSKQVHHMFTKAAKGIFE